MPSIWNKYTKIKEIYSTPNVKTYLTRIEPLIKEITPKNKDDYYIIYESLTNSKYELNIYDIIEENDKIYVIFDNKKEINDKIDKLISLEESNIKKEVNVKGHGAPINKSEILKLFKFEESMGKLHSKTLEKNKIIEGTATCFFCQMEKDNFPIKYCLFTNNHALNKTSLEIDNIITFEYYSEGKYIEKKIKIDKNRKVYTSEELDYTCIEIFESDGIKQFLKIDPYLYKYNNIDYLGNDIFTLQYPKGKDFSFSFGKILSLEGNNIVHSASTDIGSSGSPIIRRSKDNYIIGLHYGGDNKNKKFNLATNINSIIKDIQNEINCIYICDKDEIYLLHDYNYNHFQNDVKELYFKVKKLNEKLFKENIEIYVNDKKIDFDFKFKVIDSKEIKVKFKFKKKLTNTSFMFFGCSSLKSIDLSSFNTTKVEDMSNMFRGCSSLESMDLSSFDTTNVKDMNAMFYNCSSLKSIDLSTFVTTNVEDMSNMFRGCSSLESIDLSSFDTTNVKNMYAMFNDCSSLKSIDLSSFNTNNVKDMNAMFWVVLL